MNHLLLSMGTLVRQRDFPAPIGRTSLILLTCSQAGRLFPTQPGRLAIGWAIPEADIGCFCVSVALRP
jgi:hypothetical protein